MPEKILSDEEKLSDGNTYRNITYLKRTNFCVYLFLRAKKIVFCECLFLRNINFLHT